LEKVEEVTNVNFNVSVGATVPASVCYHPLPLRIVEIILNGVVTISIFVRGKYIILRPQTHEIVFIIRRLSHWIDPQDTKLETDHSETLSS
jgi:hypothetical protein